MGGGVHVAGDGGGGGYGVRGVGGGCVYKTNENENDGNEVDVNNKKVNKYQITNELKSAIKESLFNQKMKLEEEFKSL